MKKITQLLVVAMSVLSLNIAAQPTASAPTPPARSAAKVISIYSNAYTNVTGTDFNPWWGQTTAVSTITIGADNILKYANLNYQGTALSGSVNALTMNKLHVDVWSSDATSFQITPISPGPKEKLYTCTPLNLNQWNSYDIDLSQFTGVVFSEIFQFKVVGNGTVYIDNLYFYDSSATVDSEAPTAFTATKGAVTSDAVELLLNATDNSGAVNYTITYGTTTLNVGGVSATQKSYTVGGLLSNTDYSFSVVCKDATGNAAANNPIVVTAKTATGVPAAPTPTRPAANVISIYSDAYTNVANTNFYPGWGQATVVTQPQLAVGNTALKYTNLNYQGIELGSHVNAGTMTKLHVDVYTENETSLKVTPISPGKELLVALTPIVLNQWNSYDVDLSLFTGVVFTDVFQFKFEGSGGKTVYIDNLYFHDGTTAINSISADKNVKLFPTTVNNRLTIKTDSEMSQIIIRNLVGQSMKSIKATGLEQSIDMCSMAAGNYMVSVKMANGLISTQKIVKL